MIQELNINVLETLRTTDLGWCYTFANTFRIITSPYVGKGCTQTGKFTVEESLVRLNKTIKREGLPSRSTFSLSTVLAVSCLASGYAIP